MSKCDYVIPKSGSNIWQQQRECRNPAIVDGRCKKHIRKKLEETRRRKIDKLIKDIHKLGGTVVVFYYD